MKNERKFEKYLVEYKRIGYNNPAFKNNQSIDIKMMRGWLFYMYYGTIKKTDIANGIGVRVSLFVSGCTHHCKGCFQSETWDFEYGSPYTKMTQQQIMDALKAAGAEQTAEQPESGPQSGAEDGGTSGQGNDTPGGENAVQSGTEGQQDAPGGGAGENENGGDGQ